MICKVLDDNGITHHAIVGWKGNRHACDIDDWRGRPASWRRPVDCMACVAVVMSLPYCPHSEGNVIRVIFDPRYWFLARCCARCVGTIRFSRA